eukprot:1024696-Alexandrium_andersonii.AAC.1
MLDPRLQRWRGEGCLTRRASWDREPPGWILRPGPIVTGGLNDGIGAGAQNSWCSVDPSAKPDDPTEVH